MQPADVRAARRPGPAAAPPGARRHHHRVGVAVLMLTGGMLAVWIRLRQQALDAGEAWVPTGVTIPEVPANVMLAGSRRAVGVRPLDGLRRSAGATASTSACRSGSSAFSGWPSSTPRPTSTSTHRPAHRRSGYAGMFYAITGMVIVLASHRRRVHRRRRVPHPRRPRRPTRRSSLAHLVYWYVVAAAFCAVWLIVYVTK